MTNRFRIFTLVCLLATVAGRASVGSPQSATPAPAEFPQGPNRDVVVKACKECHPIAQVTKHRESRARWSQIAEKMLGEGAQMTDDEFEKVVVYLSVVLGKRIKINEASVETIADAFDIEIELAAAIVKYRGEKGPFKEWKDLLNVPGVDPQRIEEQKDNLDFSSAIAFPSVNR